MREDQDYIVHPEWNELSLKKKYKLIKEVIEEEIQPFVQMDGGGVDVIEMKDNNNVIIKYKGACAHCMAATGSTLSYIQHILRTKVHKDIVVVPKI